MSNGHRSSGRSASIVAAVVMFGLLTVALGVSVLFFEDRISGSTTPFLVTILGFLSTTTVSLLALLRIEDTRRDLTNGVISEPVKQAVQSAVSESDALDHKIREALAQTLLDNAESTWTGEERRREGTHG